MAVFAVIPLVCVFLRFLLFVNACLFVLVFALDTRSTSSFADKLLVDRRRRSDAARAAIIGLISFSDSVVSRAAFSPANMSLAEPSASDFVGSSPTVVADGRGDLDASSSPDGNNSTSDIRESTSIFSGIWSILTNDDGEASDTTSSVHGASDVTADVSRLSLASLRSSEGLDIHEVHLPANEVPLPSLSPGSSSSHSVKYRRKCSITSTTSLGLRSLPPSLLNHSSHLPNKAPRQFPIIRMPVSPRISPPASIDNNFIDTSDNCKLSVSVHSDSSSVFSSRRLNTSEGGSSNHSSPNSTVSNVSTIISSFTTLPGPSHQTSLPLPSSSLPPVPPPPSRSLLPFRPLPQVLKKTKEKVETQSS